jgi:hypothetical protein
MKVFLNRLLSIKLPLPYILFVSLAGEHGDDFADISTRTIRNVVKGILGWPLSRVCWQAQVLW